MIPLELQSRALLPEQCKIGWGQAIRGRVSRKWGVAQQMYKRERFNQVDPVPTKWAANMIFHLRKFGIDRWIARNEYIHGKSEQEQEDKRNEEINFKVTCTFLLDREKVRLDDSHLFTIPLEERRKQTWEQKRLWLLSVKAAIIAWERENLTETITQQQYLHQPVSTTPTRNTHAQIPTRNTTFSEGRRPRVRLRDYHQQT
jgi:hypothetical protein